MEKFAVDLDRVLDEFELNEDLESVNGKEHRLQNRLDTLPPLYAGDLYPTHNQFNAGATLLPPLIPTSSILLEQQFVSGGDDAFEPDATLDLSEADFAPAPLPISKTLNNRCSDAAPEPRRSSSSIETPPPCSVVEVDTLSETVLASTSSNPNWTSGVVAESSSQLQLLDEGVGGSSETDLMGDFATDDIVADVGSRASFPSRSSSVETGEVVDGIKVLHYDETINRDYLVTFGRRHDGPSAVPSLVVPPGDGIGGGGGAAAAAAAVVGDGFDDDEGIDISMAEDESRADDSLNVVVAAVDAEIKNDADISALADCSSSTGGAQWSMSSQLVDADSTTAVVDVPDAVSSISSTDESTKNVEETFVTPDDGVTSGGPFLLKAPVGFGSTVEVDVSDDELRRYLEDDDDEMIEVEVEALAVTTSASAMTPDGGIGDRSPVGREEFFTPPLDKPTSCEVESPSSSTAQHNQSAEVSAFCREPEVAVRRAVSSSIPASPSSDTSVAPPRTDNPRLSETSPTIEEDVTRSVASPPPSDQLAEQNSSPTPSQKEQANRELRRQMLLAATTTTTTATDASHVVDPIVREEADRVLAETLSASPADEGWEDDGDLQPYPSSELRSGDGTDGGDEADQRLTRPTSLHLPTVIDVEQPVPIMDSVPTPAESDEHLPFATLVATAGSPDAVALSDDCETPASGTAAAANITEEERLLGKFAPTWVPDGEAPNCMYCGMKFTVIKRRHHCRACGKVLCAQCCGTKAKLLYMENKEARVCLACMEIMQKVQEVEHEWERDGEGSGCDPLGLPTEDGAVGPSSSGASGGAGRGPNPNNPSEYCSVIPPLQQARASANAHPPTVMVPVGVLKRGGGSRPKGEPKQVMFSDGIRPGGDLTELDGAELKLPYRRQGRLQKRVEKASGQVSQAPRTCLPTVDQREYTLEDNLDMEHIMTILKDETEEPLVFSVANNLKVSLKIVDLSCCVHKVCWCFVTRGLCAVGQDEIIILLELVPEEKVLPYGVFHHLIDVYEDASKGHSVSGMGHTVLTRSFLGSKDHGGFLYIRQTFQCLQKLPLPPSPYLFGILLQKWEIPWAKVFPLRLLLRLGAEFRYYPCPLVGVRNRKPVFCEIGHTIVNLLADFRNYQYSLPAIPGLLIHMDDKNTYIMFPRNRYDEVVKALNSSIDHVMSLAASFSSTADSHLVCMQNEDGNYQTQAVNIKDKPRKVTGASFVVFNGALKTSSGLTAKSCIVEDGMMVQISSESMLALRQALRDMKDYKVECGPIGAAQPEEVVHLQWVDDDRNVNLGVKSPLDGMTMDGVSSIRIHCGTDYVGDGFLIRWTEVYLVRTDDGMGGRRSEPLDVSKVSDTLAQACCVALAPHLESLCAEGLTKIGLRVTLDAENVGYEIGAAGIPLPSVYMNDLDSELVPAMHSAASPSQEGSIVLELVFYVLQQ